MTRPASPNRPSQHYRSAAHGLRWEACLDVSPEQAQGKRWFNALMGSKSQRMAVAAEAGFDTWLHEARILDRHGRTWSPWGFLVRANAPWSHQAHDAWCPRLTGLQGLSVSGWQSHEYARPKGRGASPPPALAPRLMDTGVTLADGTALPLAVLWRCLAWAWPCDQVASSGQLQEMEARLASGPDKEWTSSTGQTTWHLLARLGSTALSTVWMASPEAYDRAQRPGAFWKARTQTAATRGLSEDDARRPDAAGRTPSSYALEQALHQVVGLQRLTTVYQRTIPEGAPGFPPKGERWGWAELRAHVAAIGRPWVDEWIPWETRDNPQHPARVACPSPNALLAQEPPLLDGEIKARAVVQVYHPHDRLPQLDAAGLNRLARWTKAPQRASALSALVAHVGAQSLGDVAMATSDGTRWSVCAHLLARGGQSSIQGVVGLHAAGVPIHADAVWRSPEGVVSPLSHAAVLGLSMVLDRHTHRQRATQASDLANVVADEWATPLAALGPALDWTARASNGDTVLHVAARYWSLREPLGDLIQWLRDHGADPRATNADGKTAGDLVLERVVAHETPDAPNPLSRSGWSHQLMELAFDDLTASLPVDEVEARRPRRRF